MKRRPVPVLRSVAGIVVAAGWAGCASEVKDVGPPRMPTMAVVAPVPTAPAATPERVTALALESARAGNAVAMASAIELLPTEERGTVVRAVVTTRVKEDLSATGRLAQAMPAGALQTQAIEVIARAMLERDAVTAAQWALDWPSPEGAAAARETVARLMVERDRRAALERLLALPESAARNQMVGFATGAWARRDAVEALAWVRALPAGALKTRAATSAGFALARTQPQRAVEVVAWLPEGRDRSALYGAIGQTWVASDSAAAWAWAQQLPAGGPRESAMAGIETGLGGAGTRIAGRIEPVTVGGGGLGPLSTALARSPAGMPPGLQRDLELRREFDAALQESPSRAANWLSTQLPIDRRDEMVDEVARRWLQLDPMMAKQWIDQNVYLPERKERLLREAGR